MCRRHNRHWALPILLALLSFARLAPAQAPPIPPAAIDDLPAPPGNVPPSNEMSLATANPGVFGLTEAPRGLPINLATAAQLAGVNPLDIAAAIASIQQSLALQLQARVLWVPNLNAGVDYFRHDGYQQNIFTGRLFVRGRQSVFAGGGPTLSVGLADAIFSPLAARRIVASRQADLQTARNDALLSVAQAYFRVQDARGRLVGVEAALIRSKMLVDFAQGLAPRLIAPLEINRAKTELESLLQYRQDSLRDWRVASAQLAEILLLDPITLLEPIEPPLLSITMIPGEPTCDAMISLAVNNRPEIASHREQVAAALLLVRQEKSRPLLPNLVAVSPATATGLLAAGNFSGGANGSMGQNNSRFDMEVAAVWELQNAGLGNIGRIRQRRAEQQSASIELTRTVFRVRSEVSQALARLQTARARVPITEEGVRQAITSADKNFEGLRETTRPAGELLRLVVRPQEVVAAIDAMNTAFQNYSGAVNEYNAAQFELYRALGQPAQWVSAQANTLAPAPATQPVPNLIPGAAPARR